MRARGQKSEARTQRSAIRGRTMSIRLWLMLAMGMTWRALAQEDLPKLQPPLGEIPPTFWEQYGMVVSLGGVALLLLLAFVIWWWLRPKPVANVSPVVEARAALERMCGRAEDGNILSSVSQTLRRYVIAAFELSPGEYSTAEFRQLVGRNDKVGVELANALSEFLRQCDERKFSGAVTTDSPPVVPGALKLVAQSELRRNQLRKAATEPALSPAPARA